MMNASDMTGDRFAEFGIRSNFSFLEGASHPEELAVTIARLGQNRFGLADRNSVAGVVRAHVAAREAGIRFHPGARLVFADGTSDILAFPRDRAGWGRLCRLLTTGNMRAEKGACTLMFEDLLEWGTGMNLLVMPASAAEPVGAGGAAERRLEILLDRLKSAFGPAVRLALVPTHDGADRTRLARLAHLARRVGIAAMASNDALYHTPGRRADQDVLAAIRHHVPVARAGRLLAPHAERHLKPAGEMARLLREHPAAITETLNFAGELSFSLDELRHQYPDESFGDLPPQEFLARLAREGAENRYPQGVPEHITRQIDYELALVAELEYAPYFLTVWDIVRFARSQNILCQGRGSAANSTICYCIGITEVGPELANMLFERFISLDRREPPDIDVDFEHERREEVIQYIYERYGRAHAGLAATVITYRARSAAREVGKAFELSEDAISALSGSVWGWSSEAMGEREAAMAGLDAADRTTRQVLDHAARLTGFPRHLSQHVGGFVITRDRLDEVMPVMNTAMEGRTMVEWDKDDLDALNILKIDILALGMLSCLARGFKLLETHYGRQLTIATIPKEDENVYRMIQRADTIGVFQIESRAQMTMLPRLKPKEFYDLVIEVAIVRPGPIQGDMVHPYLRRRQGMEPVIYPSRELEEVLQKTLGIPLFQEQAMKIAIVAAGFTPGEADRLRRAMATFRRVGIIHTFQKKMIEGMVEKGYEREFAERCFHQIEGFGEYGFPESHAASFALLVYASAWLKGVYPDVFCVAILNSQPMGFYAPAQLIRDAREHGVEVRPVDINHSDWDSDLEQAPFDPGQIASRHGGMAGMIRTAHAVRMGLRQVKGLAKSDMRRLVACRGRGYDSVRDLWLRTGLNRAVIERLADADAFSSLGLSRRAALWAARGLDAAGASESLPLFERARANTAEREAEMRLPVMPPGEEVINDYRYLSLSLKAHPLSFLRHRLARHGIRENAGLERTATGRRATVAGLVLVRQRPGSSKGVIFMTIEDETAVANIIVWPKTFERFRREVLGARLVRVTGRVQNESGVIHVIAENVEDISGELAALREEEPADTARLQSLARADEICQPVNDVPSLYKPGAAAGKKPARAAGAKAAAPPAPPDTEALRQTIAVMPKGRNFQ